MGVNFEYFRRMEGDKFEFSILKTKTINYSIGGSFLGYEYEMVGYLGAPNEAM